MEKSSRGISVSDNTLPVKVWFSVSSKILLFFWPIYLINMACSACQQPVILLNQNETKYEIATMVDVLEDPSHQLNFNDVTASAYDSLFVRSKRASLNFGYSSSDYWIRFKVRNTVSPDERNWVVEVGNPVLHKIQFFAIDDTGQLIRKETGRDIPFNQREVESRAFLFKLPDIQNTDFTIYLRLVGNENKMLDLVIWEKDSYTKYLRTNDVILAFYFGILFALSAYNLFLYFSILDRSYLYYVLFIVCTALGQSYITAWGRAYLHADGLFGEYGFLIYPFLAFFFGVAFSIRFLAIHTFYPVIYKILIGYLTVLALITSFGFYRPYFPLVVNVSSVLMILGIAALIMTGVFIARTAYRPARYFLVGWSVLMVGFLVMQLKHLGYLPATFLTRHSMKFSSAFEAIIFSLGLADRFHTTTAQLKLKTLESQKLAESEKMKADFFSNITHEFRTPLMLISGHIKQLITAGKLSPDDLDRLKGADKSTTHLNRLITQLLDISKLDAGMLKVSYQPVEVSKFFKHIRTTFYAVAEHRHILFKTDFQLPDIMILLDEDKLEKIIYNLLSNAFKFTEVGEVSLNVSLSPTVSELMIEVSDTGIGIAQENIPKIFDKFYQARGSADSGGSGIGLALTKELVLLLEGTINVQSSVQEGTRFTVRLPTIVIDHTEVELLTGSYEEATSTAPTKIPKQIPNITVPSDKTSSILIVEDNEDLRQYMNNGLHDKYTLLLAKNGREGFDLAKAHLPDIILTDWIMRDIDGITLCSQLKSDPITNHIPVILITARADTESKLKGLQTGADDYIYKPFEFEELSYKISNWISKQKMLQDKLRKNLLSEPSPMNSLFSEDEKFLFSFKEVVEKRLLDQQLSVDLLRKELGLSRVQLSRKINALLGISINEYILLVRLKRAAHLLDNNWGSVSQVAYEVGFNNLSYFSKCFKDQFGKTPSKYADN